MRIRYALLLLILVAIGLCNLAVVALINGNSVATNDTSAEPTTAATQPSTDQPESLDNLISKYVAEPDHSRCCALAKSVALSRPKLLEECAREMWNKIGDKELAIAHFATAYYQLGGKQAELISLLESSDLELVCGVLHLLRCACEIDADGKWHLDRPLGGPEMPSRIARLAVHPELHPAVAATLASYSHGIYQQQVKKEMRTVLKMLLSDDKEMRTVLKMLLSDDEDIVSVVYWSILKIDQDVFEQFGLEGGRLSKQQKADIREYLNANP